MASKPKDPPSVNGTRLIHGDASLSKDEVAPSISVTTTFKTPTDIGTITNGFDPLNPVRHVYSRYTQDNSTRAEKILSEINGGYALTYASGLTSSFAALVHYNPTCIAITGGYHGCYQTIAIYRRIKEVKIISIDDEYEEGTLCWLETPLNPTGEARNIQYYADKVHAAKGHLLIDSTFGPPPLQYPFKWGADCIMHSGTKYFGGHSDLLCGILIVKSLDQWKELWSDRTYAGNMMGSLEAWLLLRSLRTFHLRIPRQSRTATALAQWLDRVSQTPAGQEWDGVPGGIIHKVFHTSLQARTATWDIAKQMDGGWSATFSFLLEKKEYAAVLPYLVRYLVAATSLGGVESLIEHRMSSDPSSDPRLIRVSIGVEELEDLKADFRQALKRAAQEKAKL
ncbi:cystathionine gamma-synthase [Fomitiporia mediterranea MF3/22]|uniref:cystathionine gamma-synthase n=1 Tax=Fomitiporia mediterranea (strain MF3/22) TaxID=694068 RepID=UPI0004408303|nr:cystathionine gamma-synthase [Fomitiporia mediterranea MF3/22]EJD01392.1 cystathionine gamma-synthase [Fomitiporia mediterranea MF3/22]